MQRPHKKASIEIISISEESVEIAKKSGQQLSEIVPDVQKTSILVQEIVAASAEQNLNAKQISKAIEQFSMVTQQNSASAEEMSTGAEQLATQAEVLQNVIGFFKIEGTHGNFNSLNKPKQKNILKTKSTNFNFNMKTGDEKDADYERF